MTVSPSAHAARQYTATTGNLDARMALPEQRSAARALVQSTIDSAGVFRVRKHSVLITAGR